MVAPGFGWGCWGWRLGKTLFLPVRGTNEVKFNSIQYKSALFNVDSTASASEIEHLHSRMAVPTPVPLPVLFECWLFFACYLVSASNCRGLRQRNSASRKKDCVSIKAEIPVFLCRFKVNLAIP